MLVPNWARYRAIAVWLDVVCWRICSSQALIWASEMCSGPWASQPSRSVTPLTVWEVSRAHCAAIWVPTKVSSPATTSTSTIMGTRDASQPGHPACSSARLRGISAAQRSRATSRGTITSASRLNRYQTSAKNPTTSRMRQLQAAAAWSGAGTAGATLARVDSSGVDSLSGRPSGFTRAATERQERGLRGLEAGKSLLSASPDRRERAAPELSRASMDGPGQITHSDGMGRVRRGRRGALPLRPRARDRLAREFVGICPTFRQERIRSVASSSAAPVVRGDAASPMTSTCGTCPVNWPNNSWCDCLLPVTTIASIPGTSVVVPR